MSQLDDMNSTRKYKLTLICLLLSLHEINSLQSCKYDITNELNQSIADIFQTIDSHRISESLQFYQFKAPLDQANYQVENTKKHKISFHNIQTKMISNLELSLEIRWEIPNNTVRIMNPEMYFSVNGFIHMEPDKPYSSISLKAYFRCENISIIASQSDNEIQIQFKFDRFSNAYFPTLWLDGVKLSSDETTEIKDIITIMATSIIGNHFNHNEKFLDTLKAIFSHRPIDKILSIYPNFTNDDPDYCFIIRSRPYSDSKISSIFLTGLSSFQALTVKESNDHSIYSLFVKNVFGQLFIEHGIENRDPVEFTFTKNDTRPIITFDRETNVVKTDFQAYASAFIYRKYSKPNWLSEYSSVIMQLVELTLAKSITPSMEGIVKMRNRQSQLLVSIKTMLFSIAKHFEEMDRWIEQSSNNSTATTIQLTNSTSSKPYKYQISFNDMNISVISGTPCKIVKTQCELFENLKIDHEINAIPVSKSIQTDPLSTSPIIINFHGNFTSINLAIIKPGKSHENNNCSFEIRNKDDIKVIITQADGVESKIKKKLDTSVLSMVKESIVRHVKPLICYPIDICDQSVKIVDDFFLRFIDIVLEKCSLRRITSK